MTAAFTERTAIEQGFASIYQERLSPKLESLRRERAEQTSTTWILLGLYLGGHLVVAALLFFYLGEDASFAILMLFTAGIGSFELVRRRSGAFGQRLVGIVMPEVGRFLGDMRYSPEGPGEAFVTPFETLKLVGASNQKTVEHHVSGVHRGTGFELVEAHLLQRNRGSKNGPRTVFRGLLVRIRSPAVVPASIRIMCRRPLVQIHSPLEISMNIRSADYFGRLLAPLTQWFSFGRGVRAQRVAVGDAEFERRFSVFSIDPAIAETFVNPGFMTAMLAIDDDIRGRSLLRQTALAAAFDSDDFYMAISRSKSFLDTRSLLRSGVSIEEEIHAIFADLTLLHRIIDRLHDG